MAEQRLQATILTEITCQKCGEGKVLSSHHQAIILSRIQKKDSFRKSFHKLK